MERQGPGYGFLSTVLVITFTSVAIGAVFGAQPSSARDEVAAPTQDTGEGQAVYAATCASCHQAGGVGLPGTFPPLAGNPNVADTSYVEQVVRDGLSGPIEVNGEAYDTAMPAVTTLSDDEIAAVAAYVASLAEGGGPDTTIPEVDVEAEDGTVEAGHEFFTGSLRLENGGGACAGCHTAGSIGNMGGPGLGPDLTDSVEKFGGEAGLAAWLTNPPSATMMPIFGDRPLTESEIADLTTFLADAPDQSQPSTSIDWLVWAGLAGLAVLVGGMAVAYRGMRQTYVERLRSRS